MSRIHFGYGKIENIWIEFIIDFYLCSQFRKWNHIVIISWHITKKVIRECFKWLCLLINPFGGIHLSIKKYMYTMYIYGMNEILTSILANIMYSYLYTQVTYLLSTVGFCNIIFFLLLFLIEFSFSSNIHCRL